MAAHPLQNLAVFLYYIAVSKKCNGQVWRKPEGACVLKLPKQQYSCTNEIGQNGQNDEILPESKMYKDFAKNMLEKMDKNYYTYDCGRI